MVLAMYKLIVVDDEEMIRENLVGFFEDEGFDVLSAESGEEAVDIIQNEQEKPDIGFIDMRLPGIDGNTVIERASKINPNMKFIIHTGSTEYALPQHLIDIGLTENNIFFKPMSDMEAAINIVHNILKDWLVLAH